MNAELICSRLKNKISNKIVSGKVHSVFQNAMNLILIDECEETLITLLNKNRPIAPMSASFKLDQERGFNGLGIQQQYSFQIECNILSFNNSTISFDFNTAAEWNAEVPIMLYSIQPNNLVELENSIGQMGKFSEMKRLTESLNQWFPQLSLLANQASNGFYRQRDNTIDGSHRRTSNEPDFIVDRFHTFMEDYILGHQDRINQSCYGIIGFGIGLTPSMDDFINGLMIASVCLSNYQKIPTQTVKNYNFEMIKASLARTTAISAQMLRNGANGLANEAVQRLLFALIAGTPEEVRTATIAALDYGETSGTDTALGIYTGLKIWIHNDTIYRRVMSNECMRGN